MPAEAAFLDAISARPGDAFPRLLLADYLEERGEDARADAVRRDADPAVCEAKMTGYWRLREVASWNSERERYADVLPPRSPLRPMAAAPCRNYACTTNLKNGGKRPWLWRLWFRLPTSEIGSRWWRNRRMNAAPLLGFPRAVLRCVGAETLEGGLWLRFTATFKERPLSVVKRAYNGVLKDAYEEVKSAFDADVHPAGFAACFWPADHPPEWDVRSGGVPQKTLFDAVKGD